MTDQPPSWHWEHQPPPPPPNPPKQPAWPPAPSSFTMKPMRPAWVWPAIFAVTVVIVTGVIVTGFVIVSVVGDGSQETSKGLSPQSEIIKEPLPKEPAPTVATTTTTVLDDATRIAILNYLWEGYSPQEQRNLCQARKSFDTSEDMATLLQSEDPTINWELAIDIADWLRYDKCS